MLDQQALSRKNVTETLRRLLKEVQEEMGEDAPDIERNTKPIGDLPGFDSLCAASVITALSAEYSIPVDESLFWSKPGRKPLACGDIVDRVLQLAKSGGSDYDREAN